MHSPHCDWVEPQLIPNPFEVELEDKDNSFEFPNFENVKNHFASEAEMKLVIWSHEYLNNLKYRGTGKSDPALVLSPLEFEMYQDGLTPMQAYRKLNNRI
jgi:hypothetical protein